jgi:hypothetical protein
MPPLGDAVGADQLVDPERTGEVAVLPYALDDDAAALHAVERARLQRQTAAPVAGFHHVASLQVERCQIFEMEQGAARPHACALWAAWAARRLRRWRGQPRRPGGYAINCFGSRPPPSD